jgi:hypothetical protein
MMITTPILTNDVIAEAMRRARSIGCPPEGKRCSSAPRSAEGALATLEADGWCRIGSLIDVRSYGPTWDALFNVDSAEVRIERLP